MGYSGRAHGPAIYPCFLSGLDFDFCKRALTIGKTKEAPLCILCTGLDSILGIQDIFMAFEYITNLRIITLSINVTYQNNVNAYYKIQLRFIGYKGYHSPRRKHQSDKNINFNISHHEQKQKH